MPASKNRVVLGLNAYSHDAGVALLVDGELVFAAEQERFDRIKHSAAFPVEAIGAALRFSGLLPSDIDQVAFCWRRDMARARKALYVLSRLPRSLPFLTEDPDGLPARRRYLDQVAALQDHLRECSITAPVTYLDHHLAHAVQAHRFGPADNAALITADGMGEWTATATWTATGERPETLQTRSYPHSLGKFYAAVTQHLGFEPDSGEGKTMGLAPYAAKPHPGFDRILRPHPRHLYDIDLKQFRWPLGKTVMAGPAFEEIFGPPRAAGSKPTRNHCAIARGAQEALETCLLDIARHLRAETGHTHLGLAGGLFLNCVVNGRLARDSGFDSLFAFPAAGDAGAAAGAAAWVAGMPRRLLRHPFLGDAFPAPPAFGEKVADPAGVAARALAEGKLVGWFSGRMEFGPRALGARSILADPRLPGIRDRINRTVKFREDFRPFAPAVLLEEAAAWFLDARPSPFMLLTFPARPQARDRVPGVVHVDGSARVQTVGPDAPPAFRRLIEEFHKATGIPMVLNTSFNTAGEPIVRTPEEARAVFEKGALDLLVVEDRVLRKP